MNRKQIVNEVARRELVTSSLASRIFNAALDVIRDSLVSGQNVNLRDFGTFRIRHAARRKAREIHTGARVIIEARKVVKFIPGEELKKKVANSSSIPF
jgi:histone family protein DNA-binding protein